MNYAPNALSLLSASIPDPGDYRFLRYELA